MWGKEVVFGADRFCAKQKSRLPAAFLLASRIG
jgi:hypothetical protein